MIRDLETQFIQSVKKARSTGMKLGLGVVGST